MCARGKAGLQRSGLSSRGFTLIELLVTFAIVAILMMLAAPSLVSFQRNSELTATANSFVAALSAARAEAMKQQRNAFVIPANSTHDDWSQGWIVFVDVDADNALSTGDTRILAHEAMPGSVTVASGTSDNFTTSGAVYAMFSGSGFMRLIGGSFKTSALDLTNGTETRRIIANPAGRLRVCKPADAGCNSTDAM